MGVNQVLPDAIGIGRTTLGGPTIGGMDSLCFGPFTIGSGTAVIRPLMIMPADFRAENISYAAGVGAGTGTACTVTVEKGTGFAATGTALHTGVNVAGTAAVSGEVGSDKSTTFTTKVLEKGDFLLLHSNCDTATLANLIVVISGFWRGHVNNNPTSD